MTGNLAHEIVHAECRLAEMRFVLAKYPDASEVNGDYSADSAAANATFLQFHPGDNDGNQPQLVAKARLMHNGPLHVAGASLDAQVALYRLQQQHPDAYAKLLAIVVVGGRGDDIPF